MTDFAQHAERIIGRFADDPAIGAAAVSLHAEIPPSIVADIIEGARRYAGPNLVNQADVVAAFLAGIHLGALHVAENVGPVLMVTMGVEHRPKVRPKGRPRRHGR